MIEDEYYDTPEQNWYPPRDVPEYAVSWWSNSFVVDHTWNGDQVMAPQLTPQQVVEEFYKLREGLKEDWPIEACWFRDAYVPTRVVDGVPESREHGSVRGRITTRRAEYAMRYRDHLEDPNWEVNKLADEERRIAEGEIPPSQRGWD